MHFCTQCSNMYYISINPDDANKLIYYCLNFILIFKDDEGKCIFTANNHHSNFVIKKEGQYFVVLNLPKLFFNEGNFYVDLRITKNRKRVFEMNDVIFSLFMKNMARLKKFSIFF